jgi:hypothetical protein
MRILIVTDAWAPQINGVVRTLLRTRQELEGLGQEVRIISPDLFANLPCPTYPEIRLAVLPGRRLPKMIDSFQPCAIHIATEGPLGQAARRYCLKRRLPFTTAYHTRFPEYIRARTRIPVGATYRLMRRFHRPSSGVMVATRSMERELASRGFRNIRRWSRGVDTDLFRPRDKDLYDLPRPIHLYVGRVAVEKNIEDFLRLDLPGSKAGGRRRAAAAGAAAQVSGGTVRRHQGRRGAGGALCRGRPVRLSQQDRYIRPGAAGGAGIGPAGRRLSGAGAARHRRRHGCRRSRP